MSQVRPVINVTCNLCGISFTRRKQDVAASLRRNAFWQCKPCSCMKNLPNISRPIGAVRHHSQSGYLEEKTPRGWVRQHIAVMERFLDRRLLPNEVVHHKNEIQTDNRIENLKLMERGEHTALHHTGSKRTSAQCAAISLGKRNNANSSNFQHKESS